MSNVIGPVCIDDWLVMRLIRGNLSWMRGQGDAYQTCIDMEKDIYKEKMNKVLKRAA